jgi:tRNA-specific 2-thiouridylase
MKELDCDFLATGHYAKIEPGIDGRPTIVTSDDSWKDQTYFLFTIEPEVVPRLMFPIGHLNKSEVRKIAEEKNLLVARKKDSTGICFVGNLGYSNFIASQVSSDRLVGGKIRLHPSGEILGDHQGIHHFTYGQRKGLGIATRSERTESEAPLFVLRIDPETRDVWVGEESFLFSSTVKVRDARFLGAFESGERLKVKIRYAHKGAYGRVHAHAWSTFAGEVRRASTIAAGSLGFEQLNRRAADHALGLLESAQVVKNPEGPASGRGDQVVVANLQVGDGYDW